MERSIALIGLPGCGKTTLGALLAEALKLPFFDADDRVCALSRRSIPQLFEQGEAVFRAWETRALEQLLDQPRCVIACGGGAVTRPENVRLLRAKAQVIFIDRPVAQIVSDVNTQGRPLLAAGAQRVYDLHQQRDALYRAAAHAVIKNDASPGAALASLIEAIPKGVPS